jgi:ribosomal protein S18 acetylase RimI-like enzyme
MVTIQQLNDRTALAEYFSRKICLHFYSLGDLDDLFWPLTIYWGLEDKNGVDRVAALYRGDEQPVLLALADPGRFDQDYIDALLPLLPEQFYAHLSPGLEELFSKNCTIQDHGRHYKMRLANEHRLLCDDLKNICLLTADDLPELKALYEISYPENAFEERTLDSGHYYGFKEGKRLLSAGGIHVFSPAYGVAALGNITTHPQFRNRGLARAVTVRLCLSLRSDVDFIGLNVKATNGPAVGLYQSLGFEICAEYGEFTLKKA